MHQLSRRRFVMGSLAASALSLAPRSRVLGANDDIRVAIIGNGNKGNQHIGMFKKLPGVRVVGLCDADSARVSEAATKHFGGDVTQHADLREVLDRKDVDAVCVATPNHWHALATIWACQAGKDVYVEKPVAHDIWEGRQMIAAARKYDRVVQAGTQRRSDPGWQEVVRIMRAGELGRIQRVRLPFYSLRGSIGHVDHAQAVPATVDYNLWAGPAPTSPITRKQFHYDWHWFWETGNGELGNNGPHILDLARWIIGADALPPRVISVGGRFGWADDGQTPNTHVVFYDYAPAPVIIEIRNLPAKPGQRTSDNYLGVRSGVIVECEHGSFRGLAGGAIYDNDGKRVRTIDGDSGRDHQANFIAAVRSRKRSDLNCEIAEGHLSTALCLIGNISHLTGSQSTPEVVRESVKASPVMSDAAGRMIEHLALHERPNADERLVLGAALEIDPAKQAFANTPEAAAANGLLRRTYRDPFVIPDAV
ncbi:MAG: gfo/Idh/MocA family oxidoreductase [Phycisphaera sp.]|nr:gfo/Idh/MocA family oxidoreductase [Phycisphaera sp.]